MNGAYWLVEDDLKLREVCLEGHRDCIVAKKLGRGREAIRSRRQYLKKRAVWDDPEKIRSLDRNIRWTKADTEKAKLARALGMSWTEISRKIMPYRSPSSIQNRLTRQAWSGDRCRFPGCNAHVHKDNITGLCMKHKHAEGLCRCKICRGLPIAAAGRETMDCPPIDEAAFLADVERRRTDPVERAKFAEVQRGWEFMRRTGRDHVR